MIRALRIYGPSLHKECSFLTATSQASLQQKIHKPHGCCCSVFLADLQSTLTKPEARVDGVQKIFWRMRSLTRPRRFAFPPHTSLPQTSTIDLSKNCHWEFELVGVGPIPKIRFCKFLGSGLKKIEWTLCSFLRFFFSKEKPHQKAPQNPGLVSQFRPTSRGQLNWTGPIAKSC